MKVEELIQIKNQLFNYSNELTRLKGLGYGSEEDTLLNTKLCEILGIAPAEVGVYIRLLDKVVRLGRLLTSIDIPFEGLRDTVVDLINYATYVYAIVEEKRNAEAASP